jgi:uncharacterized protein YxjI
VTIVSALIEKDRLFISQKAKLFELTAEYSINDEDGNQLGSIRQEGQSKARKVLRALTKVDQFLTHRLAAFEQDGAKVVEVTRPAKIFKSTVLVKDGAGNDVGSIIQENVFGKIRFRYDDTSGQRIGGINAENWRAWNFSIVDASGAEVGRITKKWAGIGKELFTTADNYLYEIDEHVKGDLRMLAFASAISVDLALKQDE